MRFVILGTAHPFRGGLAAFNERLAEALLAVGHEVEVVTFTLQYPNFLFPGESQTDDRPAPAGYKVVQKLNSINPLSYYKTGRYIKSLNPDVIICKFWLPFMGPALGTVLRVARQNHTRVLSIIDNIVPHESRPGDSVFAKYFTKAVDHFVVMSRSVELEMKDFTKSSQEVIFHPQLRTDFIANDEVRYYFGAADLVVQPYKTATQSGISQMAYHFGTPMVVTKVGGLPEIVPNGKAGYVVDTTPSAIADAIYRYFTEADQATFRQNVPPFL